MTDVVVLGQIGRDLVLTMAALPGAGGSVPADDRIEVLGGKGANQAVALAQLGVPVALVGVVGDDGAGTAVTDQAVADGIDVRCVVRRAGARTALLVDLVENAGDRRLVESVPREVLLDARDVAGASDVVRGCRALILQLQQPGAAVRAALALAPATALVVCDGAPDDEETRRALLARADVVRADHAEAQLLVGRDLAGPEDVRAAAADLLAAGPRLVSLAAGKDGDLVVWSGGEVLVPLLGGAPVDPTGAGDAYTATLTAAVLDGAAPEDAAWLASSAAALTVGHPGGRPALTRDRLAGALREHRGPQVSPAGSVRKIEAPFAEEGARVSEIDRMLEANAQWAQRFPGSKPVQPARKVAIVACMDSRMPLFPLLGLEVGDAHVIRNGGGVITEDVVRSLTISQHLLGTRETVLVHHTDCGMQKSDDVAFADLVEQATGRRPPWSGRFFPDADDDVRESIRLIQECPYLLSHEVRGTVYDVETGQLREVR